MDNSAVCGNLLKKIFPTVKIVLEDSTHLMRRYMRTLTPGHPLNRKSQLFWGCNRVAGFVRLVQDPDYFFVHFSGFHGSSEHGFLHNA